MFFFILFLTVGSAYIYHRYRSVADKRLFFRSSFFISAVGSILIMLASVLVVNYTPDVVTITNTSPDSLLRDTTREALQRRTLDYHYRLVKQTRYDSPLGARLRNHYQDFTLSHDTTLISIGNFALGVFDMEYEHYNEALVYFNRMLLKDLPWAHYTRGQLFMMMEKPRMAEEQFNLELKIANGNHSDSFVSLAHIYYIERKLDKLKSQTGNLRASEAMPIEMMRTVSLLTQDYPQYLYWAFKGVQKRTTTTGLIAAIAILLTWLFFIYKLDIFSERKPWQILLMFLAGALSMVFIFTFIDLCDWYTTWQLNGEFFNDLIYCIVRIGIPEETVKILPLFLLLAVKRSLKNPLDYILYACASALAFAFIENLLYFQTVTQGIIHGRAYFAVIGHMVFSSFIAYGFVLNKFKHAKKKSSRYILLSFLAGAAAHGIYDFLIFQNLVLLFFIFFIFIIQVWIIIINNCLNNSPTFLYRNAGRGERSRVILTLALTSVFALEYLMVGFSEGAKVANNELYGNIFFGGILVVFFSSNLSSFNLIRRYWRDVYFSSREKRGYGTLRGPSVFSSWYLVNSIRPHNYVGMRVRLQRDAYNHTLAEVMDGDYEGVIIDRIILYEKGDPDPHWFIVKLERLIPFTTENQKYALIKLRNQNDSLLYEDEVQVFFKAIPNIQDLKTAQPKKELFPFYGWASLGVVR